MTIAEKILLSADKKCFTFFREGIFYKCYNEDMMVFVQHIKAYKVSSKLVKSVGADVYNIGFPVSEVEKGELNLAFISERIGALSFEEKENCIVFLLQNENLKNGYQGWIELIYEEKKSRFEELSMVNERTMNYQSIISEIKNYDLANTTPMQSLGFIQQLKEKVQQIERNNGNF